MPPTSIDGSDITGATIDGQDVSEITVDGNIVFEAGPDIPDSGMFQDPLIQYNSKSLALSDGDVVSSWIDQINSTDVTAEGAPTYQSNKSGFPSVFYDGNDDGHDLNNPPAFPSGTGLTVSFATTVFIPSANDGYLFWYGVQGSDGLSLEIQSDGTARLNASASSDAGHDTAYPTGEWCTIGASLDGSADDWTMHVNTSHNTGSYKNPDVDDQNHSIGYRADGTDKYADAHVYETIISGEYESNSAFDDYYNDRLG